VDYATALELSLDARCMALERLEDFRHEADLGTWIAAITFNHWRNYQAAGARRTSYSEPSDAVFQVPDQRPGPEASLIRDDWHSHVRQVVQRLPEPDRQAILLYYFADLPIRQITERIGSTPLAVRARLFKARRRLERMMPEWMTSADG
jgi:RNA polymerase sigma-70 factor (ECF subfamily)